MGLDYRKIGFKCGIECHQQLDTNKLFCKCPGILEDKPDKRIKRKLRSVAGETGEIDVAALHEEQKGKYFVYRFSNDSSCLVELDEEPPHPINKHALELGLQVALLLNAKIVDEIQVMRKTVVDGSNTSGFQRTSLIAVDGFLETSKGKVRIPTICLEEDAARKVKEDGKSVTYNLDRLGIPLIEIATETDIKDAEHAQEVAMQLGMILRSTEKVKRGLGTIRQDVNVSIKDGARTEIKGFQDLKQMPKVIENEILRQKKLIEKGKNLDKEVRRVESDLSTSFLRPLPGAARMYPETDIPTIKITKEMLKKIKLPELITEKTLKLEKKYGLSAESAREIVKEKIDFEKFTKFKIKPDFIAKVLVEMPKEIKARLNLDVSKIREKDLEEILGYYEKEGLSKEAVFELLVDKVKGKKIDIGKFKSVSADNLEKEIKEIVKTKPGLSVGAYMGIIMGKYRGKVDGKKVMQILNKLVK